MSEQIGAEKLDNIAELKSKIIHNTPCGQDPVIYWYQVAQDAIKSAEKERERTKYATAGRDKAERDLNLFTERLIARAASEKATIPLDISRLVELAQCGDIDLSVNIGIYGKDGANK